MATYDETPTGKQTFVMHNRKTSSELSVYKTMGSKVRINSQFEQRNGLPMLALGDKNYKTPAYEPGFFREGGLIAGST